MEQFVPTTDTARPQLRIYSDVWKRNLMNLASSTECLSLASTLNKNQLTQPHFYHSSSEGKTSSGLGLRNQDIFSPSPPGLSVSCHRPHWKTPHVCNLSQKKQQQRPQQQRGWWTSISDITAGMRPGRRIVHTLICYLLVTGVMTDHQWCHRLSFP